MYVLISHILFSKNFSTLFSQTNTPQSGVPPLYTYSVQSQAFFNLNIFNLLNTQNKGLLYTYYICVDKKSNYTKLEISNY